MDSRVFMEDILLQESMELRWEVENRYESYFLIDRKIGTMTAYTNS